MPQPSDRRQFQRSAFQAGVWLELPAQQGQVRLLDLSLRGAQVQVAPGWHAEPGQAGRLRLTLAGDATIEMDVRVARCAPPLLGLRCMHIDLDSLVHLRQLLAHNAAEPARLRRELAALVAATG